MHKIDVDTPALLIDLDLLESNIETMKSRLGEAGCQLRPHIKVHKTPALAHMQMAAGCIGVTCAKLGEAEVMAAAGVGNILIANQVVGPIKVSRLAGLARHANLMVAVDSQDNAAEIAAAAASYGSDLGLVIEVNVGMQRAGVEPGSSVIHLARRIGRLKNVHLAGVMGYEGHLQGVPGFSERRTLVEKSLGQLVESARLLKREGFDFEVVSAAGTNTYNIASKIDGITEVQAGSYTVMDNFHSVDGVDFQRALTVLATVTSRPGPDRAIVDAGLKAFADSSPLPTPKDRAGLGVTELSEEHGHLKLLAGADPRVREKIEFYPYYAPTTVNLYDRIYGVRNDRVEVQWDILGRGRSQ